jgi:uroporphyrinogen-III synthase
MKILITRPLEDAEATARRLEAMGHQPLVAPILATRFEEGPMLALDGVQAILATSANGVRAIARRTDRRDLAVLAVGPQTAAEAKKAGFAEVRNADGDAAALARAVPQWARPESGRLFHVRGAERTGWLAENLRAAKFEVEEAVLYRVAPQNLPADTLAALKLGKLDAALFYSPRSAATFGELARREGLDTSSLVGICISPAAADALAPLKFREIRIAAEPNQDALLDRLAE